MKACKYFLPCGYCDKYNVPCKSTTDGLIDYNVFNKLKGGFRVAFFLYILTV